MTFFGKTLVFLNLVFGIGMAVFATSLYANRPGWLGEPPDSVVPKGHSPLSIKQLAADIDSAAKSAGMANVNWTTNYKALNDAESLREKRHERMFGARVDGTKAAAKGLMDFAREGNPNGAAFLHLSEDATSRLLNLSPAEGPATIVKGPDDQPLKGTDGLLTQFVDDSAKAEAAALDSKMRRAEQKTLGEQIVVMQNRIYKQQDIRDNLLVEAARLEAFEVNATEHRQTVTRRRDQLMLRLSPFQKK